MDAQPDGVDEVFTQMLRTSMMAASRMGEQMARMRQAAARKAQAESAQAAREYEARLTAMRSEARQAYGPTSQPSWWEKREVEDIARAYEMATAWRESDPQAEQAVQEIRSQVQDRYGVEVGENPDGLAEALANVDQAKAQADIAKDEREKSRQEGDDLLLQAQVVDQTNQGHEDQTLSGEPERGEADTLRDRSEVAYDSAERRDADVAQWSKVADREAVEARRVADQAQAKPATHATRDTNTNKTRARKRAKTPQREQTRSR